MRPVIVLLSSVDTHRELMRRVRNIGSYSESEFFDRLEWNGCDFGIDLSGSVQEELEEEELLEISRRIGDFKTIAIEYSGMACIRDILVDLLKGLTGILDTDYGERLDFAEVLLRFQRQPTWDWRSLAQ